MKEHYLCLTDREAALAAEGKLKALVRVIKPQPPEKNCRLAQIIKPISYAGKYAWMRKKDTLPITPPYFNSIFGGSGTVLHGRESWMPDPPMDGTWDYYMFTDGAGYNFKELPKRFKNPSHVIYKATFGTQLSWLSPAMMPSWAIRRHFTVLTSRAMQVKDMPDWEAWMADNYKRVSSTKSWIWFAEVGINNQ